MLKPEMIYQILCISIEPFESKLDPVRTRKFPPAPNEEEELTMKADF